MPGPWPTPPTEMVQPAHRGPAPSPSRPPAAACLPVAATQRAGLSRSARACPAVRPISNPLPSGPTRTVPSPWTGITVIDLQNLHPAEPSLPVPLTGLALARRPSQVRPTPAGLHAAVTRRYGTGAGQSAAGTAAGGGHGFAPALTSLVGRADAVSEVAGLLGEFRLVTVTGPGGSGKTRPAGTVAGQMAGRFEDGCGWQSWRRSGARRWWRR
jgi:hypothetical protein